MKLPIYFDHHATTPVDARVFEAMKPFFCEEYGNAGSTHCFGRRVKIACAKARESVAALFGAKNPSDVILTSGATESINLAVKGSAFALSDKGKHIITSQAEHKAVLASCAFLETLGFEISYLPVDKHGLVTPDQLRSAIRNGKVGSKDKTILVSLIAANNEIGSIMDLKGLATACQENDLVFHLDGAQAVGKIPFSAFDLGVDLVSMSGHKIYGPKGIGALYRNSARSNLALVPLIHGGGQEGGLRSGTMPVSLVIGLGKASELAKQEGETNNLHLKSLRDFLLKELNEQQISFSLNGHPENRLSGNVSVTFQGIEAELLALGFKDIAVSTTSACNSGTPSPSHVLKSIGLTDDQASQTVRFGFGRQNTREEIKEAVAQIAVNYHKFCENSHLKKHQIVGY